MGVVSYTTAIAACVSDPKKPDIAVEWIKRMKSRLVQPNVITYNTAFASCLDDTVDGTKRASGLAKGMIADVKNQVESGIIDKDDYTNVIPNFYTRTLAKGVMQQLESQVKSGDIDEKEESSIRESKSSPADQVHVSHGAVSQVITIQAPLRGSLDNPRCLEWQLRNNLPAEVFNTR